MPEPLESNLQLVSALPSWHVTLRTGDTLQVAAHGYAIQDDVHVFSALVEGTPPHEIPLLKIPNSLVEKVRGG